MTMFDWICDTTNYIKMIDWNAFLSSGSGAFFGALGVFGFSFIKEWKQSRNEKEKELERYFYNLHFAVRNILIYMNNCASLFQWQKNHSPEENIKNKNISSSAIEFEFNESEISFVSNKKPLLYENILQLKADLKTFLNSGCEYNKKKTDEAFEDLFANFLELCPKLLATATNINNYLCKYYKHKDMYTGYIKENFTKLELYFREQIENQKNILFNNLPNLYKLKKVEEVENILTGWKIKF